jgi:hypothetical protein
MGRRTGERWVAAALAVTFALEAHADEPPYVLTYRAAPSCPSDADVRADVAAHVHDPSAATGTRIDLTIAEAAGGFEGELVATDHEGKLGRRSITGATCPEVARALAFLAGLAIDLGGRIAPDPAAAPEPAPRPPPPPEPPPAPPKPSPVVPVLPPPAPGPEILIALGAEARGGLGDGPRFASTLGLEIGDPRAQVFAPSVRVAALFGLSHVSSNAGAANLQLYAARLEACPLRLGGERVYLRACVAGEGGAVRAEGEIAVAPRSATKPWVTVEPALRVPFFVTPRFFLEANGGAIVSLVATRYYFEPDHTLFVTPRLTARAGLGLGFRLGPDRKK